VKRLYFDHNASSPLRESARKAFETWLRDPPSGNPSSAHAEGRSARRQLEDARERLCHLLGCGPDELVFTSGGTESNAWVFHDRRTVAVGALEHPSVLEPATTSSSCRLLAPDAWGAAHLIPLTQTLEGVELASVALANHETGLVQDVAALTHGVRDHELLVHSDASQAFGRIPVDVGDLGVDLLTVSAHKLGGPVGLGALVVRNGAPLEPMLRGGPQEGGRRAGTEPALLVQMFAAAAEEAVARQEEEANRHRAWIEQLTEVVVDCEPEAIFPSSGGERLPNTLCAVLPGRSGQSLVHRLDLEGVSVSHGSACASGSLEPSPVLLALGFPEELARSSVRISVGHTNTDDDVEEFVERFRSVLRSVPPRPSGKKSQAPRGD
jgi:cysteine desulfurase